MKRLAASFEIAGRQLDWGRSTREKAVLATVRAYREAMIEFAERRDLEVWYARLPAEELQERLATRADPKTTREVKRELNKALHHNHLRAFERLLEDVDGRIRFVSVPPLIVPVEELLVEEQRARYVEVIHSFLHQYRECLPPHLRSLLEGYRFVHIARKVVGVGSVGTRAWVVLMMGRDSNDPLLLQMKEATRSVLEPYTERSVYGSQGRRVVEGQRFMQAASDSLLGWYRLKAWDDREHDFTCGSSGTGSPRSTSGACLQPGCAPMARPAAGPWRVVMHARAIGSLSLPTSAPTIRSIVPSPSSPFGTPTPPRPTTRAS